MSFPFPPLPSWPFWLHGETPRHWLTRSGLIWQMKIFSVHTIAAHDFKTSLERCVHISQLISLQPSIRNEINEGSDGTKICVRLHSKLSFNKNKKKRSKNKLRTRTIKKEEPWMTKECSKIFLSLLLFLIQTCKKLALCDVQRMP